MLILVPDHLKTKKKCKHSTWKFVPDWLTASKMLEKFQDALHANDDVLFLMKIFVKSFFC